MVKTLLAITIAAVVLFLVYTQWGYLESLAEKQRLIATSKFPIVSEPAPDFSLPALDGGIGSLSDYMGQPLIIDFWTTWCGACKKEFPLFEEFHTTYGDRVGFLSICSGNSPQKAAELVREYSLTFPVLYDEGKVIARTYQPREETVKREITAFPFTVFIDSEGIVVYAKAAIFTAFEDLLDLVRRLDFPID